MAFLDKVKFWKKEEDDDFLDIDKDMKVDPGDLGPAGLPGAKKPIETPMSPGTETAPAPYGSSFDMPTPGALPSGMPPEQPNPMAHPNPRIAHSARARLSRS